MLPSFLVLFTCMVKPALVFGWDTFILVLSVKDRFNFQIKLLFCWWFSFRDLPPDFTPLFIHLISQVVHSIQSLLAQITFTRKQLWLLLLVDSFQKWASIDSESTYKNVWFFSSCNEAFISNLSVCFRLYLMVKKFQKLNQKKSGK